jgi:hypothetical protein
MFSKLLEYFFTIYYILIFKIAIKHKYNEVDYIYVLPQNKERQLSLAFSLDPEKIFY